MSLMQHIAGRELAFNKHRFLAHFDDWDTGVATALAAQEGLTLTECHWRVINFLRSYYDMHTMPPSPRVIIKQIGTYDRRRRHDAAPTPHAPHGISHQLSAHVPCTRTQLEALFPDGGCKQACRIAGLPRPYAHSC